MGFFKLFVKTMSTLDIKSELGCSVSTAGTDPLSESGISDSTTGHQDLSRGRSETTPIGLRSNATKSKKSSNSKGSSANASKLKMSKKSSKSTKSKKGQRKGKGKSANLQTVKAFIDGFNNFTCEEDLVSLFSSPEEFNFMLEDGFTMTPKMWAHCAKLINASFPDMKFTFDPFTKTTTHSEYVQMVQDIKTAIPNTMYKPHERYIQLQNPVNNVDTAS